MTFAFRNAAGFLIVLAALIPLGAQTPAKSSVCTVLGHPQAYNGQPLTLRGHVNWKTETLLIYNECHGASDGIVLVLSERDVEPRPAFDLLQNDDLDRFKEYISALVPNSTEVKNGVCIGCAWKYCRIDSTVTGRFDAVSENDARRGKGFGNAGRQRFRLVVRSIENPVAQECKH